MTPNLNKPKTKPAMRKHLEIKVDMDVKKPDEIWVAKKLMPRQSRMTIVVFLVTFLLGTATIFLFSLTSMKALAVTVGICGFTTIYFYYLLQHYLIGYSEKFNVRMRWYVKKYLRLVELVLEDKELDGKVARKLWRQMEDMKPLQKRLMLRQPVYYAPTSANIDTDSIDEPLHEFEADCAPVIEGPAVSTSGN